MVFKNFYNSSPFCLRSIRVLYRLNGLPVNSKRDSLHPIETSNHIRLLGLWRGGLHTIQEFNRIEIGTTIVWILRRSADLFPGSLLNTRYGKYFFS
jgi:hypothetical protein